MVDVQALLDKQQSSAKPIWPEDKAHQPLFGICVGNAQMRRVFKEFRAAVKVLFGDQLASTERLSTIDAALEVARELIPNMEDGQRTQIRHELLQIASLNMASP